MTQRNDVAASRGNTHPPQCASVMEIAKLRVDDVDFVCRPMTSTNLASLEELVDLESWFLTFDDIQLNFQEYPSAFFGVFDPDGQLISHVAVLPLSDTVAYLSFYVTRRGYRRRGIGRWLFDLAMSGAGQGSVVLDSVASRTTMYAASGFNTNFPLVTMTGEVDIQPLAKSSSCIQRWSQECRDAEVTITKMTAHNLAAVLAYDVTISGLDRSRFQRTWILADHSVARCAVSQASGRCAGYIVIRPKRGAGFQVSGLYADNEAVAGMLLYDVLSEEVPAGSPLLACSPETQPQMSAVFREFNIAPGPKTDNVWQMTFGKEVNLNLENVYAVFNAFSSHV